MKRAIYLLPIVLALWATKANAVEMICEEVEVDESIEETVSICVAPRAGSRITEEQRRSVNVVVVSMTMFSIGRKR